METNIKIAAINSWTKLVAMAAIVVVMLVGGFAIGMPSANAQDSYRGPSRVSFDDRLIKGQTTKAGSVYIFDRKETDIRSLISRDRKFTPLTIRNVFEERDEL